MNKIKSGPSPDSHWLLDWIQKNRYVAPLTCEQKSQYRVEPLCSP